MDADCQKCQRPYMVRENSEPTPFCDVCAQGELERVTGLLDQVGKALRNQNERWGLYGDESQAALKEFEAYATDKIMAHGGLTI